MTIEPYFADDRVTLYHGDMREILPALGVQADVVIADPPYGETALAWDRWPAGWPALVAAVTRQLWCFGSMRMLLSRRDEFAGWKLAQDLVWEKDQGSGFAADRFKRVHEVVVHWYQGGWSGLYRDPQREEHDRPHRRPGSVDRRRADRAAHAAAISAQEQIYDGTRLVRSVIQVPSVRGGHPTEKPVAILRRLVAYSCPPGGLVVDPFAGSGGALDVARTTSRRAVGIEINEKYCEVIARRLSNPLTLDAS